MISPVLLCSLVFIFGLLMGSFVHVVVLRMRTGRSWVVGRSQCMTCAHTLRWYDLVPLVSFLMLGGRCRYCHAPLAWRYSIIELVMGLWWVLVVARVGLTGDALLMGALGTLAVMIALYDLRHKIIPDIFSYLLTGVALIVVIMSALTTPAAWLSYVGGHVLGAILIPLPFFLLWLVSKGRWFGLGDVKYMVGIGLLFGFYQALETVTASFWIALIVIMLITLGEYVLGFVKKRKSPLTLSFGKEIPFGPFLSCAVMLELLGIHVFRIFFN